MSGPEFHQTGYGRRYYDHQLPEIMRSLAAIAAELKRANDLKERELNPPESQTNPAFDNDRFYQIDPSGWHKYEITFEEDNMRYHIFAANESHAEQIVRGTSAGKGKIKSIMKLESHN